MDRLINRLEPDGRSGKQHLSAAEHPHHTVRFEQASRVAEMRSREPAANTASALQTVLDKLEPDGRRDNRGLTQPAQSVSHA
jgi:hypothetical protein